MTVAPSFQPFIWIERIIALAVFLQTLELLSVRSVFSNNGIWRWGIIRREFAAFPKVARSVLDICLNYPQFVLLLIAQLLVSALFFVHTHWSLPIFLLGGVILICLRFRGTFNGGSDYMTIIVLAVVSLSLIFRSDPIIALGCLWYLALQTVLSYFVAGVVKVRQKNWRSGRALPAFLASAVYASSPAMKAAYSNRLLMLFASWAIIVFELAFPLVFVSPVLVVPVLFAAFMFHGANCFVFGLNRFLFAWAAAYPAGYFCALL